MQVATSVAKLLRIFDDIPCDKVTIPQESLNLDNRFRTSLLPWRGQFSPELVELFLTLYSQKNSVVLDPFVGSGTTLFESSRKELECYGAEINPSAVEMARTVHFAHYTQAERKEIIHAAITLAENYVRPFMRDLFSYEDVEQYTPQESEEAVDRLFGSMLHQVANEAVVRNLLVNAIIRYMNYPSSRVKGDFLRALQEHIKIVKQIPYNSRVCKVFHTDARTIPLPDASIDLIITSPPYINVFNYHQNNRAAMEILGWDLLDIAKSEIGSNRKNRQNRFLTVVQYTLDMLDTLKEMRRLLNTKGCAIIIVGRESNVRSLSFKNGLLVAALAVGGADFRLDMRQERNFKNKFGEIIHEDILHLVPSFKGEFADESFARSIGMWSLLEASARTEDNTIRNEALEAKERAYVIQKSPLFKVSDTPRKNLGLLKD